MSESKYVEISKVAKRFDGPEGPVAVVEGFDLRIARGEMVALVGHSGCGKSTVLSMIAGLTYPDEGGILLADREIVGPGPDRGVVFQAPCLLPWRTALENVLLGLDEAFPKKTRAERVAIAKKHLELVGLGDSFDVRPAQLSQGMRQRVGLARAFALAPRMLLLDEPFGMLDSLTRMELEDALLEIWQEHRITALLVTHDVDEAIFLADRIVMMTKGPRAKVGRIVDVPFARPRDRRELAEDPRWLELRESVLGFLDEQHEAEQQAEHEAENAA